VKLATAGALFVISALVVAVTSLLAGDNVALALLAWIALALVSLVVIARLDRKLQIGLPQLFLAALAIRWVVGCGVEYLVYRSSPGLFAPDEVAYDFAAKWYASYLQGHAPNPYPEGGAAVPVLVATGCYLTFGSSVMAVKLLYGVLGAWTAALCAIIAYQVDPAIARRAGYLTALLPSLVLWQVLLLKDGISLLGAVLTLACFLMLRERFRAWLLAPLTLGVVLVGVTRPYEVLFLAAACGSSLIIGDGARRFFQSVAALSVVTVMAVLVLRQTWSVPLEFDSQSLVDQIMRTRAGLAAGTGSAMPHDIVDVASPGGMLLWAPIGLFYFFMAPIPFTGGSAISLATSPEMLVWYALLPSIWKGLRQALRRHRRQTLPLLVFLLVSSMSWSMLVTNVGTLYRFRGQVVFVPLILLAIRWSSRQRPENRWAPR
jgi:hypothetical protein